ncbi:MAG TPA: hypothetical protein VFX16_16855, partial [Pseudonocardiaceae bacterium]|nr:hypothetical protein [Pseudonocardiaceae bacterium]
RLRTLPFGTGVLLLRAAKPIILTLRPWTRRPEKAQLRRSQGRLEQLIQEAHAASRATRTVRYADARPGGEPSPTTCLDE